MRNFCVEIAFLRVLFFMGKLEQKRIYTISFCVDCKFSAGSYGLVGRLGEFIGG
jgi:hypothetical protein